VDNFLLLFFFTSFQENRNHRDHDTKTPKPDTTGSPQASFFYSGKGYVPDNTEKRAKALFFTFS
jgi:hypothetical protein